MVCHAVDAFRAKMPVQDEDLRMAREAVLVHRCSLHTHCTTVPHALCRCSFPEWPDNPSLLFVAIWVILLVMQVVANMVSNDPSILRDPYAIYASYSLTWVVLDLPANLRAGFPNMGPQLVQLSKVHALL